MVFASAVFSAIHGSSSGVIILIANVMNRSQKQRLQLENLKRSNVETKRKNVFVSQKDMILVELRQIRWIVQ